MLTVEELLVLDGVRSWQAVCSRRLLYPVDPFQGRQLDVIEPLPGPVAADQLGLEQPDVGLGQGVVQRVTDCPDAGCGAGGVEPVGVAHGQVLPGLNRSTFSTWMHHFLGDDDEMLRAAAEADAISQEHGYSLLATTGAAWSGNSQPGDAPDRQVLEQSLEALARMGQQGFFAGLLARLAQLDAAAGDQRRADQHLAEAFEMVRRTGEELDLPELLRARARFTLAREGHADLVVPDLMEAVRLATERGARVSRLRAAVDLARLPARSRPEGWRSVLAQARDDMPRSATTVDTAAAGELLDR
jgi:hypothetical protein